MKKLTTLVLLTGLGVTSWIFTAEAQGEKEAKLSQRDQLRAAAQQICPVTGAKLGSHGTPIKVTVGKQKEEVFLCCKGCLKGQLKTEHWKTIHANYAKAQAKCPVMNKDLPANPKWTIADGKIIYVCCPPCTKKIAADKEKFLTKVDQLYQASLQSKK
jgi:hypothetical protein